LLFQVHASAQCIGHSETAWLHGRVAPYYTGSFLGYIRG